MYRVQCVDGYKCEPTSLSHAVQIVSVLDHVNTEFCGPHVIVNSKGEVIYRERTVK